MEDWTFHEELARPEALPSVPIDGHTPLWPEGKIPEGDWRLNLDPLRGYLFGHLFRT